jgi:DNA-3-methyladenine glycosylase I
MEKQRCEWVSKDLLSINYHDKEWGVPIYDDIILFEFLVLEGMQAGLSWMTILKKRENYRAALDNFNPQKIVHYDKNKIYELINNEGIIRNKLKIQSIITNANAFLRVQKELGSFSSYLWGFVNNTPIINYWNSSSELPASTELSDRISKDLKKRGFKFVGSTICYALMQAIGIVNDHTIHCFCRQSLE